MEQEIFFLKKKKDIQLHLNCEIYFSVHFLHLRHFSGYALFVKVKQDIRTKNPQYFVVDEKDRFQLLLSSPLLNKVHSRCPGTYKSYKS